MFIQPNKLIIRHFPSGGAGRDYKTAELGRASAAEFSCMLRFGV